MKKVVKFGGSSLASAEQFKKVGDIIRADEGRRYVVPSAPGKRNSADTKVTDMLYDCYRTAVAGRDFKKKLQNIKARYQEIIDGLNLSLDLSPEFEKIAENFAAAAGEDYAASRGEYLNGIVMANYLGYTYIDSAEVICFDENGNFLADKTDEVLSERLKDLDNAVVPGFYGAKPDGSVKTFSRGGSDITGSIVAKAVHADIYENWTDVSGFLVTDPRIVKDPEVISTITYRELRELSYMGATVLHEDAIFPVRAAGIPVNIKNTNCPQDRGTMIVSETAEPCEHIITGIAGKKGMSVINIEKDKMNSEVGFGRNVLRALEKSNVSFEHMPSGVDTMSVVIQTDKLAGKETTILDEIRSRVHPDQLYIESNLALIAVVGRGMKSARGTAAILFTALADARVNIKMIDQGSSEINIIVGVKNSEFETAIKAIYDIFVVAQI